MRLGVATLTRSQRILTAVLCAALAVALTLAVPQLRLLPAVLPLGAIVLLAVYFGPAPAYIASLVSAFGLQALVRPPATFQTRISQFLLFLGVGLFLGWTIGGRRKAREAVRRSEEQYRLLFDRNP